MAQLNLLSFCNKTLQIAKQRDGGGDLGAFLFALGLMDSRGSRGGRGGRGRGSEMESLSQCCSKMTLEVIAVGGGYFDWHDGPELNGLGGRGHVNQAIYVGAEPG